MKKVFGQTVRDIKREVNKKVLKVPGLEQKVLDATSNEPWGPHGTHLVDIAQATRNYYEYQKIMAVLWKRISDTGKNWRHVYKGLIVLEYLVAHGSERVIDEIREHAYQISILSNFQYVDSSGRDQGCNVRKKSQFLVALINDKERIQEVRQKALNSKDKYHIASSTYRSNLSSGRFDDEGRYSNRYDERNVHERERGRGCRDEDRPGKGWHGDPRSRDSYRYKNSRNKSSEKEKDQLNEDDERSGIADDESSDEGKSKSSGQSNGPPPSYEEAVGQGPGSTEDNGEGHARAEAAQPLSPHEDSTASTDKSENQDRTVAVMTSPKNEVDTLDKFDPRDSMSASTPSLSAVEMDLLGVFFDPVASNSLAIVPVAPAATTAGNDTTVNSAVGTGFEPPLSASSTINQPCENPFGDFPFFATPSENGYAPQEQNFAPMASLQHPTTSECSSPLQLTAPNAEAVWNANSGNTIQNLTCCPNNVANAVHPSMTSEFSHPELPSNQLGMDILAGLLPASGPTISPTNVCNVSTCSLTQKSLAPRLPPLSTTEESLFPQPPLSSMVKESSLPQSPLSSTNRESSFPRSMSGESSLPQSPLSSMNRESSLPQLPFSSMNKEPSLQQPQLPSTTQESWFPHPPLPSMTQEPSFPQPPPPSMTQESLFQRLPLPSMTPESLIPQSPTRTQLSIDILQGILPPAVSSPRFTNGPTPSAAQQFFSAQLPNASQIGTDIPGSNRPPSGSADPLPSHASLPAEFGSQASRLVPIISQKSLPVSVSSSGSPSSQTGLPAKTEPSKQKFEPKSTVWADTLSRGLVDLNISGPKTNPLADIGIDFDSIHRKERREEKSSPVPAASTITMGKAMGAGSGIGRAGAGGLLPPSGPMMGSGVGMGMNTGMGGGAGMGMNMGMVGGAGMGMNMGMGGGAGMAMNMGIGGGAGMGMNMGMSGRAGMGMGMNMGMGPGMGGDGARMGMGQSVGGGAASMGMGMGGYGGGMNHNGGMNMGAPNMGMTMSMGQGSSMQHNASTTQSPGMQGSYNSMMGMAGYAPQQSYGTYR